MLTKIEIDGFKNFKEFTLELNPFSAVVGPNASGKSNLFDAIKFLALLAQSDVNSAMRALRGEPSELFRQSPLESYSDMKFAIEVLLPSSGADAFGNIYSVKGQRLRYEIHISKRRGKGGWIDGVFVTYENCSIIKANHDADTYIKALKPSYSTRRNPLLETVHDGVKNISTFQIRQDGDSDSGISKRGRPIVLSAAEAGTSALSTITTPEFPHLYALRQFLTSIRFLEINPTAARASNDRFESKELRADASNLAAVLSRLKQTSKNGDISDISVDLTSLIPGVKKVIVQDGPDAKEYSFSIEMADGEIFSSRVISDGTIRLLSLLAILDDPRRAGTLCFEEPENGVHEGRIPKLISLLRSASNLNTAKEPMFQILINTHSPAVMKELELKEIIAADVVNEVVPGSVSQRYTRMRTGISENDLLDYTQSSKLTRRELDKILRNNDGGV